MMRPPSIAHCAVTGQWNTNVPKCAYDGSDRERYRMYFWAGAAYNLMYVWLREGTPIPPDTLADYCNAASLPRAET